MFFNTFIVLAAVSSSALLNVQAHGTITGVTGANGVQAAGFGIIATTPRDGSTRKPFEQDTSVIRDNEIASGKTGVCGRTAAGGNNDVAAQLAAASQAGLPTAAADGSVTMTLHQVNGDGAGPYTCDVSGDGGNTFVAATVTQQVPGKNGRSKAKATDFALTAQLPAGMACTAGPNGDACLLRCRNPANAGPFGSCVAVAQDGAAAATGNATAAAAGTAAGAAAADPAAGAAAAGTPPTDAAAGTAATGAAAGTAATGAAEAPAAGTGATAETAPADATAETAPADATAEAAPRRRDR
ncbi:GEgh 16 [Mycena venus]|uniref:GEgh 16 n=1 Tax=Mycena venus TaxID=2733690 RepID=A0A8H6X9V2_9AGAR|nr:GEgh 16 [Mycena venus]